MTAIQAEKPWDFSNVLNLISTLSNNESGTKSTPRSLEPRPVSTRSHSHQVLPKDSKTTQTFAPNGLGDFSQVWQYLGSPLDVAAPRVPPAIDTSPTLQQRLPGKLEYTSDGAMYTGSTSRRPKSLQWRDETDAGALTDVAPNKSEEDSEEKDDDRLTKKQRYKRNKRERQRLAAAEVPKKAASDVESEAEVQSIRNAPARKAGIHTPERRQSRYNLRERDSAGNAITADLTPSLQQNNNGPLSQPIAVPPSDRTNLPETCSEYPKLNKSNVNPSRARQQSEPALDLAVSRVEEAQNKHAKQWPVSNPFSAHARSFLPASVQPSPHSTAKQSFPTPVTPKAVQDATQAVQAVQHVTNNGSIPIATQTPTRSHRHVIEPKVVRSGDDRHWAFLLKLIANFYGDRGNLIRPANLSNHSKDPKGIHVFVDASNIFIGFNDQLKRARNIPTHVRVPRVDMSFDALSLLMERRRPVAKRVLAGSTPHIPAFDVAREIGYECSILDKVYKARELTERQKFFYELEHKHRKPGNRNSYHSQSGGNGNGYVSGGNGSGSETTAAVAATAPTHAPERFVEQGVDEILHLKILESVVDVDEPTTIVLATGDAAQAEYSQGFLVMVERALKKGWSVELVSWSKNINGMYKDAKFRRQWGERFKLIELDDYAEELLDM